MVRVNKPQHGPVPYLHFHNEVTQHDNGDAQMGGTGTSRKGTHVGARPLDGWPGVAGTETWGSAGRSEDLGSSSWENQELSSRKCRWSPDVHMAPHSRAEASIRGVICRGSISASEEQFRDESTQEGSFCLEEHCHLLKFL